MKGKHLLDDITSFGRQQQQQLSTTHDACRAATKGISPAKTTSHTTNDDIIIASVYHFDSSSADEKENLSFFWLSLCALR